MTQADVCINRASMLYLPGSIATGLTLLLQLYGNTTERGLALRTLEGGKLKMQDLHGEEFPPSLSTVQADYPTFQMQGPNDALLTTTSPYNESTFLAMGQPRFNVHPGHVFWNTFMMRQHNHVCELISQERPDYADEQVSVEALCYLKQQ